MSTQALRCPISPAYFRRRDRELAKRRIRSTFSRYVSTEIVEQIVADRTRPRWRLERNVAVCSTNLRLLHNHGAAHPAQIVTVALNLT